MACVEYAKDHGTEVKDWHTCTVQPSVEIISFRREGTLGRLYSDLLLMAGAALRPVQVAQRFIWSVLENSKD